MRTHFSENGHLVQVDENTPDRQLARREPLHPDDGEFDLDLAPDDGGETVDFDAIKAVPRDALKTLLRFLIPATSNTEQKRFRVAQIRVVLLAHMLDLDGLGGKSFEELGKNLGCTRALLSLYSLRLIDGMQLEKARNGKSRRSREVYSRSASEAHRRQGHRMKQDSAQSVS